MIQLRFGMVAVVIEIRIDKFRLQWLVGGKISNYFISPQKPQIKIIQLPLTNSQRLKMDNTNPEENVVEGGTQIL